MRLFPFMLLVSLLTTVVLADGPTTPRVLVLGDSISGAYGIDLDDGWPALLQRRLRDEGYPHDVVNASVSGDTTSSALARLPRTLDRHEPTIVIIQLGGNDGLRGLSPDAMHDNLAQMVTMAKAADAHVILAGVRLPENYGRAYIDRFLAVYPAVARQYDIALVPRVLDGVAENRDFMLDDGIHPNEAGQSAILENVWPALEPLL